MFRQHNCRWQVVQTLCNGTKIFIANGAAEIAFQINKINQWNRERNNCWTKRKKKQPRKFSLFGDTLASAISDEFKTDPAAQKHKSNNACTNVYWPCFQLPLTISRGHSNRYHHTNTLYIGQRQLLHLNPISKSYFTESSMLKSWCCYVRIAPMWMREKSLSVKRNFQLKTKTHKMK